MKAVMRLARVSDGEREESREKKGKDRERGRRRRRQNEIIQNDHSERGFV